MAAAAKRRATAIGVKPREVLEDIVLGRFNAEFVDGKTLISTTDAGGSVTFAQVAGLDPSKVASAAHETIAWLLTLADPDNPTDAQLYPRPIRRLRANFARATV